MLRVVRTEFERLKLPRIAARALGADEARREGRRLVLNLPTLSVAALALKAN